MSQYKNIVDSLALFYLIAGGVVAGGIGNYLRQNNQAKYWRFLILQILGGLVICYYLFFNR